MPPGQVPVPHGVVKIGRVGQKSKGKAVNDLSVCSIVYKLGAQQDLKDPPLGRKGTDWEQLAAKYEEKKQITYPAQDKGKDVTPGKALRRVWKLGNRLHSAFTKGSAGGIHRELADNQYAFSAPSIITSTYVGPPMFSNSYTPRKNDPIQRDSMQLASAISKYLDKLKLKHPNGGGCRVSAALLVSSECAAPTGAAPAAGRERQRRSSESATGSDTDGGFADTPDSGDDSDNSATAQGAGVVANPGDRARNHALLMQPDYNSGATNLAAPTGLLAPGVHEPSGTVNFAVEHPGKLPESAGDEARVRSAVLTGAQVFAGPVLSPLSALDAYIASLKETRALISGT